MAFAKYFEKNRQSAALLLQGIDAEAFKSILDGQTVCIATDEQALASPEGRASIDLAVRLLARLYPKLAFAALGKAKAAALGKYEALAKAINERIDLQSGLGGVTHCIVFGGSRPRFARGKKPFVIYSGSTNWLALVSTKAPVGSGASSNPFGAGAAACFAVANVFRMSFKEILKSAEFDTHLVFSTLEMKPVGDKAPNPRFSKRLDLGKVFLAGVGAIGNGCLWSLSRLSATGTLQVVDDEALALSNLQRYVMTQEADIDKAKVELAKGWLSGSSLDVKDHKVRWETFAGQHEARVFEAVLVAVDSARTRINIQASLPRQIFNGWTQAGEVGLSRHELDSEGACLACLYVPDKKAPHEDELIARALHLPETHDQLLEIRARIQLQRPTEMAFLERVSTAANVPIDELVPFVNKPLRDLYVQGVCGGVVVTLAKGKGSVQANEVPMAFQSALAGILMTADLVAERLGLRPRLPTKTQLNLLTSVAPIPSNAQAKAKRCFCTDADFLSVFKKKYAPEVSTRKKRARALELD